VLNCSAFGGKVAYVHMSEAFWDLDVGCGCCSPELDAVGLDGFQDGFVEKELVG
jgi:hypothetical protein